MEIHRETIDGYYVALDDDGMITVTPAFHDDAEADRILSRYSRLGEAQQRRRTVLAREAAEREARAEEARRDLARRRREANARVSACNEHRPVDARTETRGWSTCIMTMEEARAGADHTGAEHGGVRHVEVCRCGATREIESNGRHEYAGWWQAPRIDS